MNLTLANYINVEINIEALNYNSVIQRIYFYYH